MKKLSIVLLFLTATLLSVNAQKTTTFPTTNEMFKVITYRYITLKNETRDAKAAEKYYTQVFKKIGYIHELPGDGYGGPCSIIDGFYKGGYINKKKANMFVPTKKKTASVIFLSACNDGEDSDYGYLNITLTVYDKSLANKILANIKNSGFKKVQNDNNDKAVSIVNYSNGNKLVGYDYNPEEKAYNFYYSIDEQ